MELEQVPLGQLTIEDERSFRHVALYAELKARLLEDDVRFAVPRSGSPIAHEAAVSLLNLAFYKPGTVAEIFADRYVSADQLAHSAWHHLAARELGPAAHSGEGLLLAEAIASAFDVYLVGRLLGHAPGSSFLESQVPAMSEAAFVAGLDEPAFEAMIESWSREPERAFESLRQLLFDASRDLLAARDADQAAAVLARHAQHELAALLYHYELPTWVLYARAYGTDASREPVLALDAQLRAAPDSLELLRARWLA